MELREGGAKVETKCQQAEVEQGAQMLQVETGDPQVWMKLLACRHLAEHY